MPEETNIAYVTVVLVTLVTFKFQQIVRSWYSVQVTFVCTALWRIYLRSNLPNLFKIRRDLRKLWRNTFWCVFLFPTVYFELAGGVLSTTPQDCCYYDEREVVTAWTATCGSFHAHRVKVLHCFMLCVVCRNPVGRTGIRGRGCLGRWGPNHAADPIVTR